MNVAVYIQNKDLSPSEPDLAALSMPTTRFFNLADILQDLDHMQLILIFCSFETDELKRLIEQANAKKIATCLIFQEAFSDAIKEKTLFAFEGMSSSLTLALLAKFYEQYAKEINNDPAQTLFRKTYQSHCLEKVSQLNQHLLELDRPEFIEPLKKIKFIIHKFAGNAGLYGYSEVSNLCKIWETKLDTFINENKSLDENARNQLKTELLKAFAILSVEPSQVTSEEQPSIPKAEDLENKPYDFILIDDDDDVLNVVRQKAQEKSMHFLLEKNFEKAKGLLADPKLSTRVILIDLLAENEQTSGFDLLDILKQKQETITPSLVCVISSHGEHQDRIKSYDLGADLFLQKPVNYDFLLNKIESITKRPISKEKRVLLVDDDPDFCSYIKRSLENTSFSMNCCTTAKRFFELLEQKKPDIILLDIQLPDQNGIDILKTLKNDFRFYQIPVVIVTGKSDVNLIKQAYSLGIHDYIIKPIEKKVLLDSLENFVRKYIAFDVVTERDPFLGLLNKQTIVSYFETFRYSFYQISILTVQIDKELDAGQMKEFSQFMSNYFSEKEILGIWDQRHYVILFQYLWPKQLQYIISDFFKSFTNEKPQLAITLQSAISEFPKDGDDLELIVDEAIVSLQKESKNWSIISSKPSKRLQIERKILLVTSNDSFHQLVSYALELRGHRVILANTGEAGYAWIKKHLFKDPPSVILIDSELTDENALFTLEKIKGYLGERIPIIYLTPYSREEDIYEGLEKGASRYMIKPLNLNILLREIEAQLQK